MQRTARGARTIVAFVKAGIGPAVFPISQCAAADAQTVGLLIIPLSYVILGLLTIGAAARGPFDLADNITNTASRFSCEEYHGHNA